MDSHDDPTPGFAPSEPDDGRNEGDWQTKYKDPKARNSIRCEAIFLITLFITVVVLLFLTWNGSLLKLLCIADSPASGQISNHIYLALGGLLGGVLFSMKWLYHSVARTIWHEDRRLWRMLTPLISAGLAFSVGMVIKSDLFGFFDPTALDKPSGAFALGFLTGYFSDSALAKMAEVAQSLFGTTEKN